MEIPPEEFHCHIKGALFQVMLGEFIYLFIYYFYANSLDLIFFVSFFFSFQY